MNQINNNLLDNEKNIKNNNDKPKTHSNDNLIKNISNNIIDKFSNNFNDNNPYKRFEEEDNNENYQPNSNNIIIDKRNNEKSEEEKFLYNIIKKPKKTDLSFKIIMVGDYGVGKTSLIKNNSLKQFKQINNELTEFYIQINKKKFEFQIYDTCEQEKYESLNSSFYKNSSLVILVYSIDSLQSFENIEIKWLDEIKTNCKQDIKIFLIGNKKDLNINREVEEDMGEKLKTDNQFDLFLETSAKEINKENIFIEAVRQLYYENYDKDGKLKENSLKSVPHSNEINLIISNNKKENKDKKCCCCKCCKK